MKILVCISQVPDTTSKISFTNDNTEFNTTGIQFVLNPYDEIALSKAIELAEGTGGTVSVLNVGESDTEATIRKALATGADDAIRVDAVPRDAWFVANQIASHVREASYDLILTGTQSIDYNGVQVTAMVGELLDIPSVSNAKKVSVSEKRLIVEREIEGGKEVLSLPIPAIIGTAEGVAQPKIPNMRGIMSARTKPLQVVGPVDVAILSHVVKYETPAPRGTVTMVGADEVDRLVSLLHREARVF